MNSADDRSRSAGNGVGPHPDPWPTGMQYDHDLLAGGDRRNVIDRYRYWTRDAIVADLDRTRHLLHIAIENWEHDFNIGTVVRNANAFNVGGVHMIGDRRWDRRGAMVTHRYVHLHHHPSVRDFADWAAGSSMPLVAIDNVKGANAIESSSLPDRCVMIFGQEGPGLSAAMRSAASVTYAITQYGSTRSLNAGVASGIAMYAWALQHAEHGGVVDQRNV
jgi:tRNA G18 (ribose-2'-O)-methylase SpoU